MSHPPKSSPVLKAGAAAIVLLALSPALAHHTFVTKYDSGKLIRLSGTVSSVSYANPHIMFSLDTSGGSWTVETEGILAARGKALTEARLKTGAKVLITGWPSKDKSGAIGLSTITFQGGPTIKMRGTAR